MSNFDKMTIYGSDPEKYITGVHRFGEDSVKVYNRTPDGVLHERIERFYPFMFMPKAAAARLSETQYNSATTLKSHPRAHHDTLVVFDAWGDYKAARNQLGYQTVYSPASAATQYLMQTGKTLFKGIEPGEAGHLRRMDFDIEVYSSTEYFPDASRDGDEIFIIAITGSGGYEKILHTGPWRSGNFVRLENERQLITEFVKEVHRFDPDIMTHHNGFGFDLPYLIERAERLGVHFAIGRDRKRPMNWQRSKSFADREIEYTQVIAEGRSLIDTFFMAMNFDTFKREFSSYGLKYLADYFGVSSEDRTYIPGDQISHVWDTDPDKVLDYAADDARETAGIYQALGASLHEMTKALPMTMQTVQQTGQASRIESLFVREYLKRRVALPTPEKGSQSGGGYTQLFWRGVFEGCVYEDVASLYPAIMRHWDIQPEADPMGIFSFGIGFFTDERLRMKAEMNSEQDPQRKQLLDAKQTAFKTFINSFYGSLSNKYGLFCDFSEGERVADTGRKLIKRMIHVTQNLGGRVILVDTDGAMFQPPEFELGAVNEFIARVSDAMPKGIEIDNDGMFPKVLAYKPKNYVKVTGDGKYKFAGSSLRSRSIEPFLRDYIEQVVRFLMDGRVKDIHEHTQSLYRRIRAMSLTFDEIRKTQTLKKTFGEYKADLEENPNVYPSSQYEVGLRLRDKYQEDVKAGSRVAYYIAPGGGKQYQRAKAKREFDGKYDVNHYVKRLGKTAEKFEPFFSEQDFMVVFDEIRNTNQTSLFGDERKDIHKELLANVQVQEEKVNDYPHELTQPK